jgi:hypothetical protein
LGCFPHFSFQSASVRDLMDAAMCPFTFLVVIEASKTFAAKLCTIHGYSPSASPLQLKTAVVPVFTLVSCVYDRARGARTRAAPRELARIVFDALAVDAL